MDLGQRIANARKERGLTQRQVAEALSVSVQAVSLWETNKAFPPSERLRRLATLLGTDSRWLSGDADVITPDRPKAPGRVAHIIQLEELVQFLSLKDQDRSRHYEEIVATQPGAGILFAVKVTTKVVLENMLNLGPYQVATDASTSDGYSGDLLIFDTGAVPEEGDYALMVDTESDGADFGGVELGARRLPIRLSISIRKVRPPPKDTSGKAVDSLKAMGLLEDVVIGQPATLAVLVEERRLRGRAGRELYGKPLTGRRPAGPYGSDGSVADAEDEQAGAPPQQTRAAGGS